MSVLKLKRKVEEVLNMKARIKFSKTGSMRFIGHLDVMRYFQKAFLRADIKVGHSQGFSPHPIMSFTSPLGIGLSSDAEYMDIVFEEDLPASVIAGKINDVMNDEIRVKHISFVKDTAKPSMSMLTACDYLIAVKPDYTSPFTDMEFRKKNLDGFVKQDKIEILKKTKKSEKITDIRSNIYHISDNLEDFEKITEQSYGQLCIDEQCVPVLYCKIAAGSTVNIKPELVLEAFCKYSGIEYNTFAYQVHRLEMYASVDGKFVTMADCDAVLF